MYTPEQLSQLFDEESLRYIHNKNRGGSSAAKGNTYENFFAIYQIALRSQQVIESNKEIILSSQIVAFVEDLIVDCQDANPLQHYQLKNSENESWGQGLRSISDDFIKQYDLNRSISKQSHIYLVVSSRILKNKLESTMPLAIQKYSQVIYFSYDAELVKLITLEPEFQQAIEYLSAYDRPAPDKIECVAKVLLGAWASSAKTQVSIMEILKKAQDMTPCFIRSFSKDLKLDPAVENILASIADFTYNLTKGFLYWQFKDGLMEGTLPFSMETSQFKQFQELLKKNPPTCFEELEVYLPID
ncbi:hypothetical protein [Synechocystis sp. PCC 7509]|uniref:hypothetical protein n=1 Tax=Synechocystis sp. PCC 7509 TaxID=927677 RepID=UPI0002AC0911|nr:hypothetical protein [Synechocystis sp. PCC 7509]